ncbi:MAG: tetratricopeptide repeat protein [Campylobacterota bacterium]|nr:tetratricopeptide repeat protein [Campylobacterota bacterium]
MTIFQLILFITALVVFYLFFKKLFSEDYPKRGVDFEAKNADAQIGGINRPDKTFSRPVAKPDRMEQLLSMADESVEKGDMPEAKKALQSAMILDEDSIDVLSRYAYVLNGISDFGGAKEQYQKVLELTPDDDMAHASLANVLHRLNEDEEAVEHHDRSIELDSEYAPHYFNYANTLYDLGKNDEALKLYEKAYMLDPTLKEAEEMIEKLKAGSAL